MIHTLVNIISNIVGFFIYMMVLIGFCEFGAWRYACLKLKDDERVSFGLFRKLISRILKYSFGTAILFVGIRYLLIPRLGISEAWALLSLPMQFLIGWIIMWRLQGQPIEKEITMREEDHPNVGGRVTPVREIGRADTPHWRKSETKKITLLVSVQCFEKMPGGEFRPILDCSLDEGTVVTIGPLETVLSGNDFYEAVPFYYNGFLYYLRVSDIRIAGLADQLRARSNIRVVK